VASFVFADFQIAVVLNVAEDILESHRGIFTQPFKNADQLLFIDDHRADLIVDLHLEVFNPHDVKGVGNGDR